MCPGVCGGGGCEETGGTRVHAHPRALARKDAEPPTEDRASLALGRSLISLAKAWKRSNGTAARNNNKERPRQ